MRASSGSCHICAWTCLTWDLFGVNVNVNVNNLLGSVGMSSNLCCVLDDGLLEAHDWFVAIFGRVMVCVFHGDAWAFVFSVCYCFNSAWCLVCELCRLTVVWVLGESCLLCSSASAVPGVWSFLSWRKQSKPSNTQESKQQSTQQRTTARSSADLTKPNQNPAQKDTVMLHISFCVKSYRSVWDGASRATAQLHTCVVLSFEAMPGLCCFLRVTQLYVRRDCGYTDGHISSPRPFALPPLPDRLDGPYVPLRGRQQVAARPGMIHLKPQTLSDSNAFHLNTHHTCLVQSCQMT